MKRPTEVVVLGQILMPKEEILFQRATCRFSNSRSSSGKSAIYQHGLSSWHRGKKLDVIVDDT